MVSNIYTYVLLTHVDEHVTKQVALFAITTREIQKQMLEIVLLMSEDTGY